MTSLLFKCIPCARRGKIPVSAEKKKAPRQLYRKKSIEQVKCYSLSIQKTPTAPHARGFEIVETETMGTQNGINVDTQTAN